MAIARLEQLLARLGSLAQSRRPIIAALFTVSLVAAINAGANYWKHVDEWIEIINKPEDADLKGSALKTLKQIEAVTPWEDYTCANLLAVLLEGQAFELSGLLAGIEEWRDHVFIWSR